MFLIDSLLVGGLRFVLEKVTLAVDQERDEPRLHVPRDAPDRAADVDDDARAVRRARMDERSGGARDA